MRDDQKVTARIMVVDDEPQNVRYVTDVLQWAGYETVEGLTDPVEAVNRFGDFQPDLVILDLLMPVMNGFEVMDAMRESVPDDVYLPFLILTSDITSESRRRALSGGARDFLTKPMSPTEVRLRVDNLLQTRLLYLECARQANLLAEDGGPVGGDLSAEDPTLELLERWAASIDGVLPGGEGRSKRISWLSGRIAEALELPEDLVQRVRAVALLCDLGSRAVTGLSENGQRAVHTDPAAGARILAGTRLATLEVARRMLVALESHWDGNGDGGGAGGESIPIEARIVAVAIAFDDLESSGSSAAAALAAIEPLRGTRFDPAVVTALTQAQAVNA